MKPIILANIGNRNLTYQKQIIPNPRHDQPGQSFRERTQEILARYEVVEADLDEQILSVLLTHIGVENIEKIVLFASDNQLEGDRNNQDTIFEARLLQRLFEERLRLQVEIITYTKNVTHNDDLLRFYRDALQRYNQLDQAVVICDAGGTAQQKAALKITAEYLLKPGQYQVRYVDSGKVVPVEQVEYRRIIDEEQVAALVKEGQYAGALSVYEKLSVHNSDALHLLQFLSKRSDLFINDARKHITPLLAAESDILLALSLKKPLGRIPDTPFDADKWTKLAERLEVAQYRFHQGDWTRTALGLSIFSESVVNATIEAMSPYKLESNYTSEAVRLANAVNQDADKLTIKNFFTTQGNQGEVKTGLPLHLKYAQMISPGTLRQLIDQLARLNSRTSPDSGGRGIDRLRNDIAHKGRTIRENELMKETPSIREIFQSLRQLLNLPLENTYLTINELLLRKLRS